MDLPSFLWLWKIAAWSMGFSLLAYTILGFSGFWLWRHRNLQKARPRYFRTFHYVVGMIMVGLVLLLLGIGIVGTLGHYGDLGHSTHLAAGLIVVLLVSVSAFSAHQISVKKAWMHTLHITTNIILCFAFLWVSLTGWGVVQKYLP